MKKYNVLLRQAREERSWSQKEVAEKIETLPNTVSRWERGDVYPTPYFRQKLMALFPELNPFPPSLPQEPAEPDETPADRPSHEHTSERGKPAHEVFQEGINRHDDSTQPPLSPPNQPLEKKRQRASSVSSQPPHPTQPVSAQQALFSGEARSQKNRERMLRRLRRFYRELLAQSLQEMTWIDLGFTEQQEAVENAATLTLRIAHQEAKALPPEKTIIQVYEEASQELLILGEPGSGKSTQLLHLAQELVAQAEHDERCLLPVLLPLSSWAIKRNVLDEWMVEQISVIYDIPRHVSQQWVDNECILPLLDGLDEVEEAARPACIMAINAFHRAHLTPLVVCSRTGEYELATSKQRLALQSAVVVRPLTNAQVETTLDRAGAALTGLRTALREQPALQDLSTTPLMLSVLMLTYQGTTVQTGSFQPAALEQHIWTDYIQRMMERKKPGHVRPYSLSQTQPWLGWLARQMRSHQQTIFYAERLQLDWLPANLLPASTWLAVRFPAIIIGVLASLLVGLLLRWSWVYDPFLLFQIGLFGGYLGGWLSQPIDLPSEKQHVPRVPLARLGSSLLLGALYGTSFALDLRAFLSGRWLVSAGLGAGIVMAGIGWLMPALLLRQTRSAPADFLNPLPDHPFSKMVFTNIHLRRAVLIMLIVGTAVGLSVGLSIGLSSNLDYGLSFGLSDGLSLGFIGFLLSLILEKGAGMGRLAERLHWNASHLLRPGHLRNSCLFAALLFLIIGLSDVGFGLSYGLSIPLGIGLAYGLSFGLSYWLLFGFYQGIVAEQVEEKERRGFNQGIRRSLRNGFLLSMLGGGIIAGVGVLSESLTYGLTYSLYFGLNSSLNSSLSSGLSDGLTYGLTYGWFLTLSSGLLIWATLGGVTVLRHYIIRFLLVRSSTFPWRAQRFLDATTMSILLRRVGGGYSFVHRRLLDYFADASANK